MSFIFLQLRAMDSSERVHLQTHLVPGRWFSAEEYIRLLRFSPATPQIHNHHRTKGHHPDHLAEEILSGYLGAAEEKNLELQPMAYSLTARGGSGSIVLN